MRIITIGILTVIILIIGLTVICRSSRADKSDTDSTEALEKTWLGYKHYFIKQDGRVIRPKENDTVSEGQAYVMLRAVWMNDKDTFDRCYRWTENNLSRVKEKGDNLLAWHWKSGKVLDWMPASDADIDYALSLIFADARWKDAAPAETEGYGTKAAKVLTDILRLETSSSKSGRLYLSPWIADVKENFSSLPTNPSYYSPAHFRIFYKFTKSAEWEKLINTTYYILHKLSKDFGGKSGVGLIPDWCLVDGEDNFHIFEGKNPGFGWEAVRVPFRIGLDYFWFKNPDAKEFFDSGLSKFIESQEKRNGTVYCEYNYDGTSSNRYENALFYAAYYFVLKVSGSKDAENMLHRTRDYIVKHKDGWVYQDTEEYYVNSLAWLTDGIISGIVKDLSKR